MNATPQLPKVLKIGVVVDEQLVQERVIEHGQTVSVGSSARATIQAEGTGLPGDEFAIFQMQGGGYHLRFAAPMKGRVTAGGEKYALDKAAREGTAPSDGVAFLLPLVEDDKGKIEVGKYTILFRFVEAPPPPAPVAIETVDLRPKWMDDEDPMFWGLLGLFSALALVFGVWVSNAERPEATFKDLPTRFTKINMPPPEEVVVDTKTGETDQGQKKEEAKPETPKEEAKPKAKPQNATETAKAVAEARKNIMENSALFQAVIGTVGQGKMSTGLIENADGQIGDLSGKLQQVAQNGVYMGDSRLRGGAEGGTGDKGIGGVQTGSDGTADLGQAPVIKIKPSVSTEGVDFDGGDSTNVKKVVASNKGRLLYCHEMALKTNPKVAGRIVIAWTVAGGAATDVHVVDNTTDDKGLESCVVQKIRTWKFTDVPDGGVQQTFVFQPKEE